MSFPAAIDNTDGDDTWTSAFMLAHMYLEPKDAPATDGPFTQRFLVFKVARALGVRLHALPE